MLQSVLDKQREKDLKLLMCGFNAKTGADNSEHEHVMDKHELRRMNKNRELLADFCAFNNIVIGGGTFPQKDINKATWQYP